MQILALGPIRAVDVISRELDIDDDGDDDLILKVCTSKIHVLNENSKGKLL